MDRQPTWALLDMLVKTVVRHSSTIMTVNPDMMVASGVLAPQELLTAEREKEPVVVYELKRAPAMLAYPMARSSWVGSSSYLHSSDVASGAVVKAMATFSAWTNDQRRWIYYLTSTC